MIKITKVRRQAKKARYNLYEKDELFICAVSETTLIKFNLFVGREIASEELELVIASDTEARAYQSALNFLSYAIRSEYEVTKKLADLDFEDKLVNLVVTKLRQEGLLNDLEYARSFIKAKSLTTTDGPLKLQKILIEKRIKSSDIEIALNEYSLAKQLENGQQLVEKLNYKYRKEAYLKKRQKIYQQLFAKGYQSEIIDDLLQVIATENTDQERDNLMEQAQKLWLRNQKIPLTERNLKTKRALANRGFKFDLIDEVLNKLKNERE